MRRRTAVAAALVTLAVAVPAGPASADEHASCSGLVGPYYAAQGSGTRAGVTLGVVTEFQSAGMPPGANFSDFASFHDGTAEDCLA